MPVIRRSNLCLSRSLRAEDPLETLAVPGKSGKIIKLATVKRLFRES